MKIFTAQQVKIIDQHTIENEPVHSINLMERAAMAFVKKFITISGIEKHVHVFSGPGNNGGDALAIARMLRHLHYKITVYTLNMDKKPSKDNQINYNRLFDLDDIEISDLTSENRLPEIHSNEVIIDGLFGYGLTKPLEGFAANVIHHMNASGATIFSIDIPSGLKTEDNSDNIINNIIKADFTFTFEFPFLSFFFPENEIYTGQWEILPIGLSSEAIQKTESLYYFIQKNDIKPIIPTRKKFDHKGHYGHAFLIAGSHGKTGAAVLAAKACLRTGAGLLTAHVPQSGAGIMQTAIPEAMLDIPSDNNPFLNFDELKNYDAVGVGPGIGKSASMHEMVNQLVSHTGTPMVIDADALNILSEHKEWLDNLPVNSILTPHPREFERLAGKWNNSYERLQKLSGFAASYNVYVVLKGAYSSIACPDGTVLFNSTGNPGMATAGSGDVLTGMILGLLAQGYPPDEAAVTGVYLHGLAGDIAAGTISQETLIASDIIENLGNAFRQIKNTDL